MNDPTMAVIMTLAAINVSYEIDQVYGKYVIEKLNELPPNIIE